MSHRSILHVRVSRIFVREGHDVAESDCTAGQGIILRITLYDCFSGFAIVSRRQTRSIVAKPGCNSFLRSDFIFDLSPIRDA